MKRFRFKLETLLKVTRSKKEEAEVQFAEASRRLEADKEKLHEKHQRKLKKILTPEQYEKWQSNHPKRKDERKMPPPPIEQP